MHRPRLVAALGAVAFMTSIDSAMAATYAVGHTVKRIEVAGTAPSELRGVDVHLWYPADAANAAARPLTVYRSALYGKPLPTQWDPLSWSLTSKLAREDASVESAAKPFPVIVFSHGSVNDPLNEATMLERIAGAGFVVASPSHVTDTQDDVRIDYINQQAGTRLFQCNDGLTRTGPVVANECSRPGSATNQAVLNQRMVDRSRDISKVLDSLPGWLGARADMAKVGVLGHSRGTLSGLGAAGGSTTWGVAKEPRVQAVMGMASGGTQAATLQPNLADVRVPTLWVAGGRDLNSPLAANQAGYNAIGGADKTFLLLPDAHHRTFLSTFCDQLQASGAITQANLARAILDAHTFTALLTNNVSGNAVDYCPFATFTSPVDIRPLVASRTGFNVTAQNVPTTGLSQDSATQQMADLAVSFFTTKLASAAGGAVNATVPATLSLTLGSVPSLGAFTPGVDGTYTASTTATLISSAGDAALSVVDPSAAATGRLVNGTFALAEPLRVRANAAPYAPLGTLLTYPGPISNDVVTLGFQQHIGPSEPLRSGNYSKTLTFTLSTTNP